MLRAFLRGFVYAARGIAGAVQQERNFRFHICAALYVYGFSLFYNFSRMEYILLTIIVAGVMALELVNSAIERVVDIACPDKAPLAGLAKDMAAGAVLVFSLGAAAAGVCLFWDFKVFRSILSFFTSNIVYLLLLICSVAASIWFVFGYNSEGKK